MDSVRARNLSLVITRLHHTGPMSRAELTRRTGFNRSTVGTLVTELAESGLAYETEPPDVGRVGRPSPLVHANERVAAIAIHPDVDAVTVGLVGLGGKVHRRVRQETSAVPTVPDTIAISRSILSDLRPELEQMDRIVGVGVALPGLVRAATGHVLLAPHLRWSDEPLAAPMSEALGLPVNAANDATLGSLAESIYGASVGVQEAVYLNGSASGIGGGVIAGGVPLHGAAGYAGELGHMLVNSNGQPCHCGRTGCLDAEVRLERLLAAAGVERADQEELEDAVRRNPSPRLTREVERQADYLAVALVNLVNIFNPEMIVLGGFLAAIHAGKGERLAAAVEAGALGSLGRHVRIERAGLGSELLLVGAAELAFARVLAHSADTRSR